VGAEEARLDQRQVDQDVDPSEPPDRGLFDRKRL
jgi:hypothetical protein